MDKKALRKEIKAKKSAMTLQQIDACSCALTEKALRSPLFQSASSIYAYLPYNQEVRTWKLLRAAKRLGKRVAVPKVYGDVMHFLWLDDLDAVAPGSFGIPEPVADEPIADDPKALVLMPGLAFDPDGHRIGYGGGFYDKFLAEEKGHPTLALCYGFQLYKHLETDPHDIPVDEVIWEDVK